MAEFEAGVRVRGRYVNSTDNDLEYWGLDYPPLSALLALAFGKVSQLVSLQLVIAQQSTLHGHLCVVVFYVRRIM